MAKSNWSNYERWAKRKSDEYLNDYIKQHAPAFAAAKLLGGNPQFNDDHVKNGVTRRKLKAAIKILEQRKKLPAITVWMEEYGTLSFEDKS